MNTTKNMQRLYYTLLLLLESATLGVFCALDLVLFFLFWELTLIPLYFLISLWGVGPNRRYAAVKYTLLMLAGGVPLLFGFLLLAFNHADVAGTGVPAGLAWSYPELVKHSLSVSQLCWSIAAALGGRAADREEAAIAGLLHDVGMYEVDYRKVYRHPSPGAKEKRLYQQHVISGAKTAAEIGSDKIARAIRHHHERWDGNGYPDRLVRESIPPLARLIHVAETYDTLTGNHSYLVPVSSAKALSIIKSGAGSQFDPDVVEALAGVKG